MHKKTSKIYYFIILISVFCNINYLHGQKQKQTDKVKVKYQDLSQEDRRKFDYYFYEAMNAKAIGKYDSAFDLLKYCNSIDSTNANILYELGSYYNSFDDQNAAINYYRKAVTYDNENFYYNMAYATLCLQSKQYSDAIEQFSKLSESNPENPDLYLYLSEAYRLDGEIPKAISSLDKLEQLVGLNEKISLQKYQLYTLLKQEKKAFAEIQKYIDKYPSEIKYYILLGDLYMQAGRKDDAFLVYSKAKSIDPEDPYLISSISEYYEQTNNKAAAETELKLALISPKMDVETKLAILTQYVGTLQQNKKDIESANPLFDSLMIQHPQEPKLNLMYGNLLMLENKKDDARFQYQVFAESNPTNPIGWEQMLGTVFPDSIDLAIKICSDAISYIPDQPQFYFYKGVSEYMKEEYPEALVTLKKGLTFVDEKNSKLLSDFYGQIGDLYYHLEKKDSAFIAYDKALQYFPNNLGVLNNYSYFLALNKKNLPKAEKMSGLTIKAEPTNPTYLDTYAWVLFEQGAYTMAKIYLEKAISYSEERKEELSYEMLEHYGDVLFKTGDEPKAIEYWERAKKAASEKDNTDILDRKIKTRTYIIDENKK